MSDRLGSRNTPTAAYASFSPALHYNAEDETYVGGLFWDGRANTLTEQAGMPLLNPLEMNNSDKQVVVQQHVAMEQILAPHFERAYVMALQCRLNSVPQPPDATGRS